MHRVWGLRLKDRFFSHTFLARSDGNCRCLQDGVTGALGNGENWWTKIPQMLESIWANIFSKQRWATSYYPVLNQWTCRYTKGIIDCIDCIHRAGLQHVMCCLVFSNLGFPVTSLLCSKFPQEAWEQTPAGLFIKYYGLGLVLNLMKLQQVGKVMRFGTHTAYPRVQKEVHSRCFNATLDSVQVS